MKKPTIPPFLAEFAVSHDDYLGLLIYDNGREYPIEYHRLNTAEKALDWVRHLTQKIGVRTEHLYVLVDVAAQLGAKIVDA